MSYMRTWAASYAAESIKRFELNRWSEDPSWEWLYFAVECGEVSALAGRAAADAGDDFAASVSNTVVSNRKITDKQRFILARALGEHFGSARAVAAEVWGLSEGDIDNADA